MTDHPSSEPWRLACLQGHRNLEHSAGGYYCDTCGAFYPSEQITDVKYDDGGVA